MENNKICLSKNLKCARVKPMQKNPYEPKWNSGNIEYYYSDIKVGDNYGILTGKINNLFVIDIDFYKIGSMKDEHKKIFIEEQETFMVESPNGGLHLYFEYDDKLKLFGSPVEIHGNIDIRSDGYAIMGPGSKTENGLYKIVCNKKPIKLTDRWYTLIDNAITKKNIHKKMVSNIDCSDNILDQLKAKLESMHYKDIELIKNNYKGWDLKYDHSNFICKVCSINHDHIDSFVYRNYSGYWLGCYSTNTNANKNPVFLINDNTININEPIPEYEFAETLAKLCKGRFVVYKKKIYEWNGVYWKNYELLGGLYEFISQDLKNHYNSIINKIKSQYAIDNPNGIPDNIIKNINKISKQIAKLGDIKIQKSIIEFYINRKDVNCVEEWNKKPNLFAFNNCIWDLDKSCFVEPDPLDYINLTCGYDYIEPSNEIMEEVQNIIKDINYNEDCYDYLMTITSTLLFRYNIEEAAYFFTGSGGNGKGFYLEFIKNVLGKYSSMLPLDYYTTPTKSGANAELINCKDARLIWTSETEAQGNLQASFYDAPFKTLSGGDDINCRPLYSNDIIKFKAGVPWILCNTLPKFTNLDDSHKRRIKVITLPWNYVEEVTELGSYTNGGNQKKRDSSLKSKFCNNDEYKCAMFKIISTIYYRKYKENNSIKMPEYINNMTNDYFDENDKVGAFLRKALIGSLNEKIPVSELNKHFNKYCGNMTSDLFGKSINRLASIYPKKCVRYNSKMVMCIINYKLNTEYIDNLEKEYNEKNNIINDILDA